MNDTPVQVLRAGRAVFFNSESVLTGRCFVFRFKELFSPSRPFGVIVRFGRPYISNGPKTCVLVVLPVYLF